MNNFESIDFYFTVVRHQVGTETVMGIELNRKTASRDQSKDMYCILKEAYVGKDIDGGSSECS